MQHRLFTLELAIDIRVHNGYSQSGSFEALSLASVAKRMKFAMLALNYFISLFKR